MPRKKKLPVKGDPEIIREGNAVVKIYASPVKGRPRYIVAYRGSDSRRMTRSFANYNEARLGAENAAVEIHNGTLEKLELKGGDRRAHERAATIAAELDQPLDSALMEFKEARALLPEGVSLVEAARFFARHGAGIVEKRSLAEVVESFIGQLNADNRSKRHVEDARARLHKLAASFNIPIDEVSQRELQSWLNGLEVAGRTKNNFRGILVSLFKFARSHGYLPSGLPTAAEGLRKAREDSGEVGILTPGDMAKLLKAASDRLVPLLAIGGFAGLRTSEILRLEWGEINFDESHIEIKSGKSKTAQRRLAPLLPNLGAWLAPYRGRTGPVCPTNEVETERRALAKTLEIPWPNNALRHSFGSYRMAITDDAQKVAVEMGNSPSMIFRNYRKVVTRSEAGKWFD
ncbi:MAG: tyrosine-type recombinase/integrase, partial [Verrucomicrobiales bacterium]|nr:tyrosine-type recombinase/integrase [Verrucomicrobiales bacterium]